MKKFILIIILLIFINNIIASDLRVILLTPKEVIRLNLSETYNSSLGISNLNNESIEINLEVPKDIIMKLKPINFTLNPNETRYIDYYILINKTGNYTSSINILYKKDYMNFGLQKLIVFNIPLMEKRQDTKKNNYLLFISLLIITIIFIYIIINYIIRNTTKISERRYKNEKYNN